MNLMEDRGSKGAEHAGVDGTFKVEVSYTGTGSFKGVNVTEMWIFLNTESLDGVIQGVGHGTVTTSSSEMV